MSQANQLVAVDARRTRTRLFPEVRGLIHLVRGERVLLDARLGKALRRETATSNKAVRRNPRRFPADFMFQLTDQEAEL